MPGHCQLPNPVFPPTSPRECHSVQWTQRRVTLLSLHSMRGEDTEPRRARKGKGTGRQDSCSANDPEGTEDRRPVSAGPATDGCVPPACVSCSLEQAKTLQNTNLDDACRSGCVWLGVFNPVLELTLNIC